MHNVCMSKLNLIENIFSAAAVVNLAPGAGKNNDLMCHECLLISRLYTNKIRKSTHAGRFTRIPPVLRKPIESVCYKPVFTHETTKRFQIPAQYEKMGLFLNYFSRTRDYVRNLSKELSNRSLYRANAIRNAFCISIPGKELKNSRGRAEKVFAAPVFYEHGQSRIKTKTRTKVAGAGTGRKPVQILLLRRASEGGVFPTTSLGTRPVTVCFEITFTSPTPGIYVRINTSPSPGTGFPSLTTTAAPGGK